ncbi:MAG: hypothetical protein AB8I08_07080 [Sandaracinaceae bacterium]
MKHALLLFLGVMQCGTTAPPPTEGPPALSGDPGPLDALNRRHGRLRERMRRRGYGAEVALARTFVLEQRGAVFPLDLSVGGCSTFIGLGGGSIREMSLSLYDDEGREAASDSVEGEAGLVHVCPQGEGAQRRAYYLVAQAHEGTGAVMLAHFRSDSGDGEGFDGLFEGVLAPRVPFRDVEEHLSGARNALRARGFTPVGPPVLERVTEGAVVRMPVLLESDRCYAATARSGEGLLDIDLYLFDQAGVEVGRDLAGDAEPSIELCPEVSARHTVELRAYEGAGAVGVVVFEGPREERAEPATVETAQEAPGDPALALDVLAAPLSTRGFAPPLFVSRDAAIVPGEVRTHDVVVGPGCALIAGTASHDGMDLDLYLADDAGREVDRDTAVQSTARVRACREEATVLRVAVKGYGRDGAYALAILRAPDAVQTLQALRLEEATAPFRARGYLSRFQAAAQLATGARYRRTMRVEAGDCLAVAAAGDADAVDLDLVLRDRDDEPVASETGPAPHAAVSRCAEQDEALTLEVSMVRGEGNVAIQVLGPPSEPEARPGRPPTDTAPTDMASTDDPTEAPPRPDGPAESEPAGASQVENPETTESAQVEAESDTPAD